MSERQIENVDNHFAAALSKLQPAATTLSRDELMFAAGREAALRELETAPAAHQRERTIELRLWPIVTVASWLITVGLLVLKFDSPHELEIKSGTIVAFEVDPVEDETHELQDTPVMSAFPSPQHVAKFESVSDMLPETSNLTPALFREWQRDPQTVELEATDRNRRRSQATYAELSDELLKTNFSSQLRSDSL